MLIDCGYHDHPLKSVFYYHVFPWKNKIWRYEISYGFHVAHYGEMFPSEVIQCLFHSRLNGRNPRLLHFLDLG